MHPAIQIYAGINLFITGYYYADEVKYAHEDEKLSVWLKVAIVLLFGVALFVFAFIWTLCFRGWKWLNQTLYVTALYDVYFSSRYENMAIGELVKLNRLVQKRQKYSPSNWMFRFVVQKINQRNKFTFHPKEKLY